jgi:ferritin-like metal-binding protein YciE
MTCCAAIVGTERNTKGTAMSELRDSLIKELGDVYDAEQQLVKALPKMAQAASSPELKEAMEGHLRETEQQVERLKEVFESLGVPLKSKPCKAMQGLIAEAEQGIKDADGDAALIAMAQKIEHYEIASYGTLRSWASLLEEEDIADLLADTLDEEKGCDEQLTEIAESTANIEAAEDEAADMEDEEEEESPK